MRFKLVSILILLTIVFSSTVFAECPTTHCFRVDLSGAVSVGYAHQGVICDAATSGGCGDYDLIFRPGGVFGVTNISNYNITCDDGDSGSYNQFAALWTPRVFSRLLTTNNGGAGPASTGSTRGCINPNNGEACYKDGGSYINGGYGACCAGGTMGYGPQDGMNYTFTPPEDIGEMDVGVYYARIAPPGVSPYNTSINYSLIDSKHIFVGSPSLFVFGPEKRKLSGTYDNTGSYTEEIFFTLLNQSYLENTIESYSIDCGNNPNVSCSLTGGDGQTGGYVGYKIGNGESMIIRGTVTVSGDEVPSSFPVSLNVEFSVDAIPNCPGDTDDQGHELNEVINCETESYPSTYEVALMDQQDFQVQLVGSADQTSCIGPDGIFGQTGEKFAPRVNIDFGGGVGADGSAVQIDECDAKSLIDADGDGKYESVGTNNDWVYCSQKEFLVELGRKLDRIAKIKEIIHDLNSSNFEQDIASMNVFRKEEGIIANFDAYIRGQTFDDEIIGESLAQLSGDTVAFTNIGLGDRFGQNEGDRSKSLENLMTSIVDFNPTGDYEPGLYSVSIEFTEQTSSGAYSGTSFGTGSPDLLFNGDDLSGGYAPNTEVQIVVKMVKKQDPTFDWFFYKNGETEMSDSFITIEGNDLKATTTNVDKRGIILEYSTSTVTGDENKAYRSYAVPLFVKVGAGAGGDTNASFIIDRDNASISPSYLQNDVNIFTYWSGFASTLGDGCSSIKDPLGTEALPFRIPDLKKSVPQTGGIEFELDELQYTPNNEMFLETVLYLPMDSTGTGKGTSINWAAPNSLFTKDGLCTDNCAIDLSMTSHKLGNTGGSLLKTIFDGIADEEICVYNEIKAEESKWLMFWNKEKILGDLEIAKGIAVENSLAEMCTATDRVS